MSEEKTHICPECGKELRIEFDSGYPWWVCSCGFCDAVNREEEKNE